MLTYKFDSVTVQGDPGLRVCVNSNLILQRILRKQTNRRSIRVSLFPWQERKSKKDSAEKGGSHLFLASQLKNCLLFSICTKPERVGSIEKNFDHLNIIFEAARFYKKTQSDVHRLITNPPLEAQSNTITKYG